ncbi:hypothetical protein EFB14_32475 [Rhizobium fabae]|uniref:Secreted protein n=1 Tax=Rhizobium fabae TaxID=573179 RepID=A0ABY0AZI1_9HYPH|nr:hypothetical protein EFB14_32475 [Rhizobium fabae]
MRVFFSIAIALFLLKLSDAQQLAVPRHDGLVLKVFVQCAGRKSPLSMNSHDEVFGSHPFKALDWGVRLFKSAYLSCFVI